MTFFLGFLIALLYGEACASTARQDHGDDLLWFALGVFGYVFGMTAPYFLDVLLGFLQPYI